MLPFISSKFWTDEPSSCWTAFYFKYDLTLIINRKSKETRKQTRLWQIRREKKRAQYYSHNYYLWPIWSYRFMDLAKFMKSYNQIENTSII